MGNVWISGVYNMRYYAQYNESNVLISIGTGYGGTEITEEEYNILLAEIREKAVFVNQLYNDEITINEVPEDWKEEIQRRVDERIALDAEADSQPVSADEFYTMVEEVL